MFKIIFEKDKIVSLFIWSFFSFSVIKFLSIFIYLFIDPFLYQVILYSFLFFIYFFIFRTRFGISLTYLQYVISDFLFVLGITIFSYSYFKFVMLDNDYFNFISYIAILIATLIFTSLLFLLTLIKRK